MQQGYRNPPSPFDKHFGKLSAALRATPPAPLPEGEGSSGWVSIRAGALLEPRRSCGLSSERSERIETNNEFPNLHPKN